MRMRRSKISFWVLSEESIRDRPLDHIIQDCHTGDLVLASTEFEDYHVSTREMAKLLYEAGSDPGFFQLDDDGNKIDD